MIVYVLLEILEKLQFKQSEIFFNVFFSEHC